MTNHHTTQGDTTMTDTWNDRADFEQSRADVESLRELQYARWTWPTPNPMDRIVSGIPFAPEPVDDRTETERAAHRVHMAETELRMARDMWTATLPELTPELACSNCGQDDQFTMITTGCVTTARVSRVEDDTASTPYMGAHRSECDGNGDAVWLRCDHYWRTDDGVIHWCYTEHQLPDAEIGWG